MSWLSRIFNVFRTSKVDRDLDEELRFHFESRVEELMRQGMTRGDAEAHAARKLGNQLRLREKSRDIKLLPWLESVVQDIRFGVRTLGKNPAVSAAAVLSLALAVGACVAAFSLLDALMLRRLPVRDPDSLVFLSHGGKGDFIMTTVFSYPAFGWIRDSAREKVDVFATSPQQGSRQGVLPGSGGEEEKVRSQSVSGNMFDILGVSPAIGRVIKPSDDERPGEHPVAVISHSFWKRRFAGNPNVLGQWIQVEQRPYQIIGVAMEGFTGTEPGLLTDLWVPTMMFDRQSLTNANWGWLRVWGRLRPGVGREEARAILEHAYLSMPPVLSGSGGKKPGGVFPTEPPKLEVHAAGGGLSALREKFRRPLLILAAVVVLVLLIACSNIANLLIARAAAREREMALRASIGGSRARLIQQVLVESGLLAAAACALGLIFALAAAPLILRMLAPADSPAYLDLRIDWRLVAFVAALGGAITLLFGLAPALRASRVSPNEILSAGGGRHSSRLGLLRPLVAAQVAFSLMLLFVGGLLLVSFQRLMRLDLGFSKSGILLLSVETRTKAESEAASVSGSRVLDRIRQMKEVESASSSEWALFRGWSRSSDVHLPDGRSAGSYQLFVSPGFFETMRIRVLDGREFEARDLEPNAPGAVIVNEAFARRFFPGERAVGKVVESRSRGAAQREQIVGVVANAKDNEVREPKLFLYRLHRGAAGTLQVRTKGDPLRLASMLRNEVLDVHPSLRVTDVSLQSSLVNSTLLRERLLALLSGFFGIVGVVLAAVGFYGVLSYFVVRRTREIGIRMALGARHTEVVRSILSHIALAVACGITGGLAGGLYVARFIVPLLFEVKPMDFWSLALPVAALLASAALAAIPPSRRAARVDPIVALRYE